MRMKDLRERLGNLESKYVELDRAFQIAKVENNVLRKQMENMRKDHNDILTLVNKVHNDK